MQTTNAKLIDAGFTVLRSGDARQPIIKEAFAFWRESSLKDSTLVSQLSRNRDLKVGSLKASPWMRDDERQTLRMERLAELMDDSVAVANSTKLIAALADLQMPDGGFAWYKYPGCKSSTWATGEVLELLGEVKHLGYHKPNATFDAIVKKALDYYDAETIADSKKKENKKSLYAGYAYVRSLHSDVPMSKDASKLVKKTLKRMGKEWGKLHLSQGEKAFWAMTLFRGGNTKEASRIVESIRQFAITKPELGMYWDNYSSGGWFTPHQVAVTATVLQAMGEVDPRKDELDQVRKWMLLSKQTGDWGDGSMAADAVQALLNTGTDWLQRGAKPEILLNGQPVEFSDFDAYVGYCRKTIEASESSAITVTAPQNHPAWGAIYSQWSQPMTTVAEASVDAIAISKEVNVYRGDGKVSHRDELRVGDKVQVRLVITTNREIDYLTVTDERAACFEPVDRISGYAVQDGTYYYRETKDAQTNLKMAPTIIARRRTHRPTCSSTACAKARTCSVTTSMSPHRAHSAWAWPRHSRNRRPKSQHIRQEPRSSWHPPRNETTNDETHFIYRHAAGWGVVAPASKCAEMVGWRHLHAPCQRTSRGGLPRHPGQRGETPQVFQATGMGHDARAPLRRPAAGPPPPSRRGRVPRPALCD